MTRSLFVRLNCCWMPTEQQVHGIARCSYVNTHRGNDFLSFHLFFSDVYVKIRFKYLSLDFYYASSAFRKENGVSMTTWNIHTIITNWEWRKKNESLRFRHRMSMKSNNSWATFVLFSISPNINGKNDFVLILFFDSYDVRYVRAQQSIWTSFCTFRIFRWKRKKKLDLELIWYEWPTYRNNLPSWKRKWNKKKWVDKLVRRCMPCTGPWGAMTLV